MSLAIAQAALEYYKGREEARENAQQARTFLNQISAKINQVINLITNTRLDDLRGDVRGVQTKLDDYKATNNSQFLVDVISRSADILGDLSIIISRIDTQFDYAIEAYNLYIVLVGLRSIAWAEYKYIFSSSPTEIENINGLIRTLLTEAIEYTDEVMTELLEKTNNRFGELEEAWTYDVITIPSEGMDTGDSQIAKYYKTWRYLFDNQWTRASKTSSYVLGRKNAHSQWRPPSEELPSDYDSKKEEGKTILRRHVRRVRNESTSEYDIIMEKLRITI